MRLTHASRHVVVLNSAALRIAGLTTNAADPPGGQVDRDPVTGEPTGVLHELNAWVGSRVVPRRDRREMQRGLRDVADRYAGWGVTTVHDATTRNGPEEWGLFGELSTDPAFPLRLRMMFGPEHLPDLTERGFTPRTGSDRLRLSAMKILLAGHDGQVALERGWLPDQETLTRQVLAGHRAGHQVAIHAYDEWSVHLATTAFEEALAAVPGPDHRHRIEHASICPDWLAERIQAGGLAVVTQPGFLAAQGDRYLAQSHPDWIRDLYRVGGLLRRGIPVAFGSDAPVGPADPSLIVRGAVQRRSPGGRDLAREERISIPEALMALTATAAWVGFDETCLGVLRPGARADLAVFDRDPAAIPPDEFETLRCHLTLVDGRVAWSADGHGPG